MDISSRIMPPKTHWDNTYAILALFECYFVLCTVRMLMFGFILDFVKLYI